MERKIGIFFIVLMAFLYLLIFFSNIQEREQYKNSMEKALNELKESKIIDCDIIMNNNMYHVKFNFPKNEALVTVNKSEVKIDLTTGYTTTIKGNEIYTKHLNINNVKSFTDYIENQLKIKLNIKKIMGESKVLIDSELITNEDSLGLEKITYQIKNNNKIKVYGIEVNGKLIYNIQYS